MKTKTKNTNTNRAYINNVPIRHGEVTVITSDNAVATMKHSSLLACSTQKAGVPVLLVNCGMSDKRFREYFYENHDTSSSKQEVILMSSVRGNLIGARDAIDQIAAETGTGVLIIAGWEWTSDSYRRKQRLLSYLRGLAEERDVAIVIYSHIANSPVAGEIDHGGLGKLALLAMFVVEIEASELMESALPKPPALVIRSLEDEAAAERSAQVLINKINGMQGSRSDIPVQFGEKKDNPETDKNVRPTELVERTSVRSGVTKIDGRTKACTERSECVHPTMGENKINPNLVKKAGKKVLFL